MKRPRNQTSGSEWSSIRIVGEVMRRISKSEILRLMRKMLVEFRNSFVLKTTNGMRRFPGHPKVSNATQMVVAETLK